MLAPHSPLSPRTAMVTLATLAALATLATLAAAEDSELPLNHYVTMLHKGPLGHELNESLGPFYIPHGQCSGVLDKLLTCPSGAPPAAVRVRVVDGAAYPRVALPDSLRGASVLRALPCRGEAAVTLHLACRAPPL